MFSVIIPSRNRPKYLQRCLKSLMEISYSKPWEIIVVNDGGKYTFQGMHDTLRDFSIPIRQVNLGQGGPAKARNAGARISKGDKLVFLDDDCRATPEWLAAIEAGFYETGCDGLGGSLLNPYPHNLAAQFAQYNSDFIHLYYLDKLENALLIQSNNAAYKRDLFLEVGGFDESFPLAAAEDWELSYRIAGKGYHQIYYPRAQVWHDHPITNWGIIRQHFRYGRGAYLFHLRQRSVLHFHPIQPKYSRKFPFFYFGLRKYLQKIKAPFSIRLLNFGRAISSRIGWGYEACFQYFNKI